MRGPTGSAGTSRSAAIRSSSGAVISVGWIGGDAAVEQRVSGRPVAGCVRGGEVDAAEAVHLQVDEAGHRDPAAALRREADRDDAPVRDLDVAAQRARPRRSPPRRRASSRRVLLEGPPDDAAGRIEPRPRVRCVEAGEQRDDRDLRRRRPTTRARRRPLPRRRRSRSRRRGERGCGASRCSRRRRPSGCRRSCRGAPSPRSRSCSARASGPCRPSSASSPRSPRARRRRRPRGRRAGRARDSWAQTTATVSAPACARRARGADHVGRRAARRQQRRRRRARSTPAAATSAAPAASSSSAASCATASAVAPAGDQRDHLLGRDAERRPALGRVDERQPAGRAGADVDEPAAALEPLDDRRRSPRRAVAAALRTALGTAASSSLISSTRSCVERRSMSERPET